MKNVVSGLKPLFENKLISVEDALRELEAFSALVPDVETEKKASENIIIPHAHYKPFEGSNVKLMQRLLTGKDKKGIKVDSTRLPITTKKLAIGRLGRLPDANESDTKYLRNVYIDTSTAVLPNPTGDDVKFHREHPLIYTLTPETKLNSHNLHITQEQYDSSNGFRLNKEQANELRNNPYALPRVRRAFWLDQFENDTKLTEDYINYVEKTTGVKFDNIMGISPPNTKGLRLLGVGRADDYWSNAIGYYLGDGSGRLVGIVAEPQLVAKKMGVSLEKLL